MTSCNVKISPYEEVIIGSLKLLNSKIVFRLQFISEINIEIKIKL